MAKPRGYWNNKEHCAEAASQCEGRNEFRLRFSGAFKSAYKNGWLDEFFPDSKTTKITPAEYEQWLAENRPEITALEPYTGSHDKIMHRCEIDGHEWMAAPTTIKRKCATVCPGCDALKKGYRLRGHWTFDSCMEDAARFTSRKDWKKESGGALNVAVRNNWYEQCCAHMEKFSRPAGYWTLETCMEDARPFSCPSDWSKASNAGYCAAGRNGWLEQCCAHMERLVIRWTEDELIADAQRFTTRVEWRRGSKKAYWTAEFRGGDIWDKCTAHMELGGGHDNDAVYAWLVIEAPDHVVMPLPGYHLVKSGVTSQKRGDERPRTTMRDNEMQGEILAVCATSEADAPYFEEVMQSIGVQPVFPDDEHLLLDGRTEFRLISDEEIGFIYELLGVKEAQAEAA